MEDQILIRAYDQRYRPVNVFESNENVTKIYYIEFPTRRDYDRYKSFLEGFGWGAIPDYRWNAIIPPKEGIWAYNPDIVSAYDGPWRELRVKSLDEYILDMKNLEEDSLKGGTDDGYET